MSDIYICGHRNPDMDSCCSAVAYEYLKNKIDRANNYIACRCGHLNRQTKYIFNQVGLKPPLLLKDLYPKVKDILKIEIDSIDSNLPIALAMRIFNDKNISILPVYENQKFVGLISLNELNAFFLTEYSSTRPIYNFVVDNFTQVLPGKILKYGHSSKFQAPLMVGAMPYDESIKHIEALSLKPILIVGQRKKLLEYAVRNQFPAIILTGWNLEDEVEFDYSSYQGTIFLSTLDTAQTIRLLRLSVPIFQIMKNDYPILDQDDHFDEAKKRLLDSDYRGLPVYSEGNFVGVVTRRCFIDKPQKRLIMVDHNEANQSIAGVESALITEIIDHHRLAAEKTNTPIQICFLPVGSTCTIVMNQFTIHGVEIPKEYATILLAGIISDTVMLKSPTTTEIDIQAVKKLSKLADVDFIEFGKRLFQESASISEMDIDKMIGADFKIYEHNGNSFGVGQIEVTTLENVADVEADIFFYLDRYKKANKLSFSCLLLTNVLKENSLLYCTKSDLVEKRLIYQKIKPQCYDLPGILSRKKQLLPEILRVFEGNE